MKKIRDAKIRNPHPPHVRSVSITGTGSYTPERVLTNADLEKMVQTSHDWIVTRTGMKERHIARPDQATSDLAIEAARRALADAGLTPDQLDMIIVATITPDMVFPNTGCFVQRALGAKKAFCMDIEAACSGFLYALEIGRQFVGSSAINTALVIGAEKLSSIIDWEDRNTCVLFGDGAGAAILQACGAKHGVLTTVLGSDGALANLLMLPGGGSRNPTSAETLKQRMHYMKMSGREVFKHAVTNMTQAARTALARCGLGIEDVDCIIPHQANIRIVEAIGERLDVGKDRFFLNIEKYGNTSAASVIIALDEAARGGRIHKGDVVVLLGFGGGFTWGASVIEWWK